MKKLLLFAAIAGLGLISASPPDKGPDNGPREARRHYPPCSRTVTDSCMQTGERHRHEHARHHRHARGGHDHHARAGHHHGARAGHAHAMRPPAAAHRRLAHRVRRAGERG